MALHVLVLSQGGKPELGPGEVLKLPTPHKPYTVRLILPGSSPILNSTKVLKCNFPVNGAEFDRRKFVEYDIDAKLTENCEVDIEITHSGAFTVEFPSNPKVEFDFLVPSFFEVDNKNLYSNALCVQTVLSKLVDPQGSVKSDRWHHTLEQIRYKNYNMIHFVPLQLRGESGSPFSISDQLSWDKHTFPEGESDVEYLVEELKRLHILGLSDVVLNHTASDSPWLKDHLGAGYSVKTAPHMESAVELDTQLLKVSGVQIKDADDLDQIHDIVRGITENSKLWEFYVVDVEHHSQTVGQHPYQGSPPSDLPTKLSELAQQFVNKGGAKNFDTLGGRFHRKLDSSLLAEYVAGSAFSAKQIADEINSKLYEEYNGDMAAATASIRDRQRYLRLDANGPQIGSEVNKDAPLIESYFNRKFGEPLACNGWVWDGNPLVDHAGPHSRAYLRRELIVWNDCTKLRYGDRPEDSPFIWDHMSKYAKLIAKYFHGVRIDNAHSTPLHVGQYILDEARKVRPNLYVVAELFSGSQEMDKIYIEKLGISSLLREAIMPGNPKDLSTVVHNNGGLAIGSFIDPVVRGTTAHAWLMEVTHDNETMSEMHTAENTLSTAGLVAMCQVVSGTTLGGDECYSHALSVVTEDREYILGGGITEAKRVLNELHKDMAEKEMFESYTDLKGQYVSVHRINPNAGEGVFLVARTKFFADGQQQLDPIELEASHAEFVGGWAINVTGDVAKDTKEKIAIVPVELKSIKIEAQNHDGGCTINIPEEEFPQGSVAVWRTRRTFNADHIESLVREPATEAVQDLSLLDLNVLLYHAEGEERVTTNGKRGVYTVPGLGELKYAGLEGWAAHLTNIVKHQDLGNPICANLRDGLWAFEYIVNRLEGNDRFNKAREWLQTRLDAVRRVPTFMRPRYFAATVLALYFAATEHALQHMKLDPVKTSRFYKDLVLTSVQMVAELPNCSLFPHKQTPTMAAGLPHFSEGVMRCWGRDVFLSVGGLLIRLNRFEEAKEHILGFGATLKYGLIPNLLDSGRNPRYNARDAAWFFVECVQDYCRATESLDILNYKTTRRFPLDDSYTEEATDIESTVGELVFEVLKRHAAGIEFREHNAGPEIDMNMKSNGFNQKIWVDWSNGLVFGGNQDNCGTWQDKMGESKLAGNAGVPGTPRDGAAIEITGLLKSCLRWVNETRGKYDWPHTISKQDNQGEISTEDWEKLIQDNFERCYYIPEDESLAGAKYDIDWSIVNRCGIYKDTYRSGKPYEDYQFRSNFTVAASVAPELFDANKFAKTLEIADEVLRGPVGMATLDPSDWNYRPYYLNSVESGDFAISRGRNYHQGPEWVWQYGTFLQSLVKNMQRQEVSKEKIIGAVRERIQGHVKWIQQSPWRGLTELTQRNGELCDDSSPTQAWSTARLIEAIHHIPQHD